MKKKQLVLYVQLLFVDTAPPSAAGAANDPVLWEQLALKAWFVLSHQLSMVLCVSVIAPS